MKNFPTQRLSETEIRAIYQGKIPKFYYSYLKEGQTEKDFEWLIDRALESDWFLLSGDVEVDSLLVDSGNLIIHGDLKVKQLKIEEGSELFVCGTFNFVDDDDITVDLNLQVADNSFGKCLGCSSLFYWNFEEICPECSTQLEGNNVLQCEHLFENGRCTKCYWSGRKSTFIKSIVKFKEQLLEELFQAFEHHHRPEEFTNPRCCSECNDHNEMMKTATTLQSLEGTHLGYISWSPLFFLTDDAWMHLLPRIIELIFQKDTSDIEMGSFFLKSEYREPLPDLNGKQLDKLISAFELMKELEDKLELYYMSDIEEIVSYWKKRKTLLEV